MKKTRVEKEKLTKKDLREFYNEAKAIISDMRAITTQLHTLQEEQRILQRDQTLYLDVIKLLLKRQKGMEERITELEYIVNSLNLLN